MNAEKPSQKLRRTDAAMLPGTDTTMLPGVILTFRGIDTELRNLQTALKGGYASIQHDNKRDQELSDRAAQNPRYVGQQFGKPKVLEVVSELMEIIEGAGVASLYYEQQQKDVSDILTAIVRFSLLEESKRENSTYSFQVGDIPITLSYERRARNDFVLHIQTSGNYKITEYDNRVLQEVMKELMRSARMQDIINISSETPVSAVCLNEERERNLCNAQTELFGPQVVNVVREEVKKRGVREVFRDGDIEEDSGESKKS